MLENYLYAFYRFHTVLTETGGNTLSELSEDSAKLKTHNAILLKIQTQVKIVYNLKTWSLTCLKDKDTISSIFFYFH